jgi:rhodanese-related sulfurtransferase
MYQRQCQNEALPLVDVRSPAEFGTVHVQGAKLFPLDRFEPEHVIASLGGNGLGRHEPLYLTCHSGMRARQAAQRLQERGYDNLVLLEGGTQAWAQAGLPVVRGRPAMSLERQMQITLGLLVLLKVIFGFTLHPLFFGLLAAIGVGLIYAGLTQHCMLMKLLARMPWNRGGMSGAGAPA